MSKTVDYGIDLGTTNSCIAKMEGSSVRVFQNNDQMNVTPSAVLITKMGRVIVGRRAQRAMMTDTDNVAIEFKRWMGQKDHRIFPASGRELSAEQLSAEVIKALREDVRRQEGADVSAAVVTVPAAFGALQCAATARAAELAGLQEAHLLQEPIAAAIGYGNRAGASDQKWLVFDLGGGTLDIAVVSTRDGHLNVLEHRGDNHLGGKEIDRAIVDTVFWPVLESQYCFEASGPGSAQDAVRRRLRAHAEEAKIDLSRDSEVIVSLVNVGDDDLGEPVEVEIRINRRQLNSLMAPLVDRCIALSQEALAGARIEGRDLDRILLVGGPTQSPFLRECVTDQLGAPVDFSADPMTVVGQGAAIYASVLDRRAGSSVSVAGPSTVGLKLAFESVCSELTCAVSGRVIGAQERIEIKIDAEGGLWTSGWIAPDDGFFEATIVLKERTVTEFWVYARGESGQLLETDTPHFSVRHGLVPSSPPLPHSISVEVVGPTGQPALDPVFTKGSPLPAERIVRYRATHALVPGNPETDLVVKLWEGEFLDDPDANEWVGNVILSHDGVKRSVPEGAEISLAIQVTSSRLIEVEAFVPHLNKHFSGRLFVPQREEQDFTEMSRRAIDEIDVYRGRLRTLEEISVRDDDGMAGQEIAALKREVDDLETNAPDWGDANSRPDPDDARRTVEKLKTVRGKLGRLERRANATPPPPEETEGLSELVEAAAEVVEQFGIALDKQQLVLLRNELERATTKEPTAVKRVCGEISSLRWRVLFRQDWYWKEIFEALKSDDSTFVNRDEANRLFARGDSALESGDGQELREVVRALWGLQPKRAADAIRERALSSGLKRF